MGGKSRKTGTVSRKLIDRIKNESNKKNLLVEKDKTNKSNSENKKQSNNLGLF